MKRILAAIGMLTVTAMFLCAMIGAQQPHTGTPTASNQEGQIRRLTSVPRAIELVRPCVVQIIRTLPPGTPGQHIIRLGSGFLVSHNHIITARHVINQPNMPAEQLMIALPLPDSERMRGSFTDARAIIIDQDEANDLALLEVMPSGPSSIIDGKVVKVGTGVASLDPARPIDGTQIAVSGYPLRNFILITNVGWLASAWSLDESHSGRDRYIADMRVNGGNSGGPVYEVETGKVLGVCIAYQPAPLMSGGQPLLTPDNRDLSYNSGLSVIVPARYVIDLMIKNKVGVLTP
jgi:S1-C subfamily serine protease